MSATITPTAAVVGIVTCAGGDNDSEVLSDACLAQAEDGVKVVIDLGVDSEAAAYLTGHLAGLLDEGIVSLLGADLLGVAGYTVTDELRTRLEKLRELVNRPY